MADEIATARERSRLLREMMGRIQQVTDTALVESWPTEPHDIFIDLSTARTKEVIFDDPVPGLAIQAVSVPQSVTLHINRPNGPTYDPLQESLYVMYPIRRVYITNAAGSGTLHLRIHRDPIFLFTVTPELSTAFIQYLDISGNKQNLALENTQQSVLGKVTNIDTNTSATSTKLDNTNANLASIDTKVGNIDADTDKLQAFDLKTSIAAGQVTVGTTAVQLPNVVVPYGKAVSIKALAANTGKVYIGTSGVTTGMGYELSAGDEAPSLMVSNLNVLYAIADSANQTICYIVEQ
jgi:hypothetical protein